MALKQKLTKVSKNIGSIRSLSRGLPLEFRELVGVFCGGLMRPFHLTWRSCPVLAPYAHREYRRDRAAGESSGLMFRAKSGRGAVTLQFQTPDLVEFATRPANRLPNGRGSETQCADTGPGSETGSGH